MVNNHIIIIHHHSSFIIIHYYHHYHHSLLSPSFIHYYHHHHSSFIIIHYHHLLLLLHKLTSFSQPFVDSTIHSNISSSTHIPSGYCSSQTHLPFSSPLPALQDSSHSSEEKVSVTRAVSRL